MLDPCSRHIYTDQLKPPEGYSLDKAVATTFSLDLLSLLMAPISMVFQNSSIENNGIHDPVTMMESLNRIADNFIVFCQNGRILLPPQDTLLYSLLEKVVVQVQPPEKNGVFHPKLWVLRFTGEKEEAPVIYRLLCLSKNLTFDKSWDTVLTLEGYFESSRINGYGLNRPLGQFLLSLPECAMHDLNSSRKEIITKIADEITRVRFNPPEEFEDINGFIPIGIQGYKRFPRFAKFDRALIVSPFLSGTTLNKITASSRQNIVVSRFSTLEDIPLKTFNLIKENTEFYVLDEMTEIPEAASDNSPDQEIKIGIDDLSGLHAKLIIAEKGKNTIVYTGSANVTNPAFAGDNIEFMIALSGLKRNIGIEQFLGSEDEKMSFVSMLQPYNRSTEVAQVDHVQKELEDMLELSRNIILGLNMNISIVENGDKEFNIILSTSNKLTDFPEGVTCSCYPITISAVHSRDLKDLTSDSKLAFNSLTVEALTGFIAFIMTARYSSRTANTSFVLNLPVSGMPAERDQHILKKVVSDQETFIRYLMLILESDDSIDALYRPGHKKTCGGVGNNKFLPLFEELVKAFSREPDKIERISSIIEDIKNTGEADIILPDGFDELWQAFTIKDNIKR